MADKKVSFLGRIINVVGAMCRGMRAFWRWYKSIYVGRPWYVKAFSAFASLVVFLFVYSVMVFFNVFWLFGKDRKSVV